LRERLKKPWDHNFPERGIAKSQVRAADYYASWVLGHCEIQLRKPRGKYGQHRGSVKVAI